MQQTLFYANKFEQKPQQLYFDSFFSFLFKSSKIQAEKIVTRAKPTLRLSILISLYAFGINDMRKIHTDNTLLAYSLT
jgi:hypothetical protein